MKNHNTHYATLRLERQNSRYPLYVVGYTRPSGVLRGYLCRNRRLSPDISRAKVFFDLDEARNFAHYDLEQNRCFVFRYAWDRSALCNKVVAMYSLDCSFAA